MKSAAAYFLVAGLLSLLQLTAQTNWTKYPQLVLARSTLFPSWKGLATADPYVMSDNDTLKMWYSGSGWLTSGDDCPHLRMGYAWSLDGISWNEYANNPVLDISSNPSDFDYDGIETPTVIKDPSASASQRYKLWYAGRKSRCSAVNDHQFGYATSPDGINWTKYAGNPVMATGSNTSWYNTFISNPSVLKESGQYKMWFTAPDLVINNQPTDGKGNIGYATSPDGIAWTVYPAPVLIAGAQANWDSASIAEPSVLKAGSTYHMFYSALDQWTVENFQVGYATSTDGINWIKSTQNPVLKTGTGAQWDRYWASHAAVIYDTAGTKFRMWYTGRDTATISSLAGYYWDIGYAQSSVATGLPKQPENERFLRIFPNPASDQLTLQADVDKGELSITDQFGMAHKTILISDNATLRIDVSTLPNGLYFLMLTSKSKQRTGKFTVQR